jgi:hypothetical protein
MRRLPSPACETVIQNRVSVTYKGHVYMYCWLDGDESAIAKVVRDDVETGRLHPFAGGMLCFLIEVGETEATD